MRGALLVLSNLLVLVPLARAQQAPDGAVVVYADLARGDGSARSLAPIVSGALVRASGATSIIAPAEAARLFEARASAPAVAVESSLISALPERVARATDLYAMGRRQEFYDELRALRRETDRALETYNRELAVASGVLNACLLLVRYLVEAGRREQALEEALHCSRTVPGVQPSPERNPPRIIGLFAEAQARLRVSPHATLVVESVPSGCAVYLFGRQGRSTPYRLEPLPVGEHRVQVACAGRPPGRVHRVFLGPEVRTLRIDARFDEAVRTGPALGLEHPSAEDQARYLIGDARAIARIAGAREAFVVAADRARGAALRIDRLQVDTGRVVASMWLGGHRTEQAIERAVAGLVRGESGEIGSPDGARFNAREPWRPGAERRTVATGPAPRRTTPRQRGAGGELRAGSEPVETAPVVQPSAGARIAGWTLGAAGAVAIGIGWGLYARGRELNRLALVAEPGDPDFFTRRDRDEGFRVWPALVTALGGALASASMPLWLPGERGVPWWGWVSGIAGVGVAGIGIYYFAVDDTCTLQLEGGACVRQADGVPIGVMLLSHAAPMLAVPITYLVRGLGAPATVSFGADASSLVVSVRLGPL